MSPLIRAEGLARTFDGPEPVHAVRDCSFEMEHGEMVAIMGPSGSGKSTLLHLLGLLDRPSGGTYLLEGVDVAGFSEPERAALRAWKVGFVFQDYSLLPGRTALDNVMLGGMYRRTSRIQRRERSATALDSVGLTHRRDSLVDTLSGGERQRVAIARAIAESPTLLLCDEPTGNLDSATGGVVMDILSEQAHTGQAVIVVTHSPDVARFATRRFVMTDGALSGGLRP